MEFDLFTILLSVTLVIFSVFGVRYYRRDWRRFVTMVEKFPGPPTLPLLGNALAVVMVPRNSIIEMLDERNRKYGTIYRSWVGSNMADIHLSRPEDIEVDHMRLLQIQREWGKWSAEHSIKFYSYVSIQHTPSIFLSSSKHIDKSWAYDLLHPWLGLGLLTNKGQKWRSRRKLITPTFHFSILEQFCDIFVEKSELMVEKLMAEVHAKGENSFDVYPFITRCTLDIICQTAMGTNIHAQEDTQSEYVRAVIDISQAVVTRTFRPYLHPDFIFNRTPTGKTYNHCLAVLHGFTDKVINERKEENAKNGSCEKLDEDLYFGKKRMAFLDLLLQSSQDGTKLSDSDLREEVDTFMFEGHDTTTAGITWALFLLGNYPKIQEKVVEELDAIFEGDCERGITMRDLNEMKYLERVIKETLRLYPSVPAIARDIQEDTQCGNYLIPAGCTVILHIYHVQRNAHHFPNPDEFDPDRFLPERTQGRHPYAYIPFSAGPRNCIGQKFAMLEEKTMLASILRRFRIRSVEEHKNIKMISELVLRPESGMPMVFVPRSQKYS